MLPSSGQRNTYKHLYFLEKAGSAKEFSAFSFSEWSYGTEVLGGDSAEDADCVKAQSFIWALRQSIEPRFKRPSLSGQPGCTYVTPVAWLELPPGRREMESSSITWSPLCVSIYARPAGMRELFIPLGTASSCFCHVCLSSHKVLRVVFPQEASVAYVVWERQRFAVLGERSPSRTYVVPNHREVTVYEEFLLTNYQCNVSALFLLCKMSEPWFSFTYMTPVGLEAWPHPEICGKHGQLSSYLKTIHLRTRKCKTPVLPWYFRQLWN